MKSDDEEEVEEKTDGWMTTYSDLVTLLLTFFVLLFAISNIDAMKFALIKAAFSREGLTVERFTEIQHEYNMQGSGEPDWENPELPGPDDNTALAELSRNINGYIADHNLEGSLSALYNGDHILMTISNDVWFRSGSAEITEIMRERGADIAGLLAQVFDPDAPFDMVVAGHTDNVPINTPQFRNNWWLSSARATNFTELIIAASGLPARYFSIRAFGEELPAASNETAEGRQINRRVDVLISQPLSNAGAPDYVDAVTVG